MQIFKFQPFSTTKELGKEYNAHCTLVPDPEDWILILDHDAQIMVPEAYQVIENAITKYPGTAIFSALTNRVGYPQQCYVGQISDNDSYLHHRAIAAHMAEKFKDGTCQEAFTVAGFLLLFKKSFWLKNPFQENIISPEGLYFDKAFCMYAKNNGMKIRIINGVYVFHAYRIHKDRYDKSHLI